MSYLRLIQDYSNDEGIGAMLGGGGGWGQYSSYYAIPQRGLPSPRAYIPSQSD